MELAQQPDWSQLPENALALALQYVNQQHRLTNCALVSSSWAAAAAAATPSITAALNVAATADHDSLQSWLAAYGSSTTSLAVSTTGEAAAALPDFSQLPCAKLCSLRLEGVGIRHSSLATPCTLQQATQLLELVIINCLTDDASQLALCIPSTLQALTIKGCLPPGNVEPQMVTSEGRSALPAAFLQQLSRRLSRLTSLALLGNVSEASVQHLSALSTLRSLELRLAPRALCQHPVTTAGLSGLATLTQLTQLALLWAKDTGGDWPH